MISVAATVDVSGPINDPVLRSVKRSLGSSLIRGLVRNALRPKRALESRLATREGERQDPCDLILLRRGEERNATGIEGEAAAFEAASEDPPAVSAGR